VEGFLVRVDSLMQTHARLSLLGSPGFAGDGQQIAVTRHHIALLSWFVVNGADAHPREAVARLLWPGVGIASARHSLSQSLYTLRTLCGGVPVVSGSRDILRLTNLSSDLGELRLAVEVQDWRTAEGLLAGTLLEGFHLRGASEFNDWLDEERDRFYRLAREVVEGLELDGEMVRAADCASRLGWHRTQAPVTLLSSPGPDSSRHRPEPPSATFFVGRTSEISDLEGCYGRAVSEGFHTVVLQGEPGIGKTTLARRFARLCALRGSRVLSATGFAPEENVPFGIVAQWLRDIGSRYPSGLEVSWRSIIAEAFPGTGHGETARGPSSVTEGVPGEYRLLEALRRWLDAASAQSPLLLVLDDAHFADAASLGLIHYASRRSPTSPVLFIATTRAPSVSGPQHFSGWDIDKRILLGPLSHEDTGVLIARFPGGQRDPTPEVVRDMHRTTGGNPLLLSSLLASGRIEGDSEVPESVRNFFIPRLQTLSPEALVLIAALSLANDSRIEVASRIAGIAVSPSMQAAVRELENARLVVGSDSSVMLKHGIVGEVALGMISSADRRALYGRSARALTEAGESSPAVAAVHHDIAGDRQKAFDAAVSAAAASYHLHAPREQEFFLKLALSNAPDSHAVGRIRIDLANLFRRLGRPAEAIAVIAEPTMADAPWQLQRQAQATRLIVRLSKVQIDRSIEDVWTEIHDLETDLDPHLNAELYYELAAASHNLGHTGNAIAAAQRSLAISRRLPLTPRSSRLASASALVIGLYTRAEDGLATIAELIAGVDSNPEALAQCVSAQATLLVATGRLLEAEAQFLHCIELVERCCLYAMLFRLHNNLGVCYTEQGRFDDAQQQLEQAARVVGPSNAAIAADNLGLLLLERGLYEDALENLREHPQADDTGSTRGLFLRHALVGLCMLELGRLSKAFEVKREIEMLLTQREYWSNDASYLEAFLARMLVLEGKPEAARARLETALEVYRGRDMMCRSRLELELARIDLKADPGAALERAENMLELLRGTGARPLIERFEEIADRARLRSD
jgi:tetratricopeptide (TPR) repeat protein